MKLSIEWLNDYVSTDGYTPEQLADKLLNIGFEVEEIIRLGEDIDRVVAGKITDIKKHPDADKLSVCSVDVGSETVTIVTGAKNVKAGDTVPVALDGATLPGEKVIKAAPLRGVMSYGMMCSGKELGVDNEVIDGAEVDGILILQAVAAGTDIKEVLRLNDTVLDVSVTANRPDCQSVYGMAREVAAVLGRKLKPLEIKYDTVSCELKPSVDIRDGACGRYTCQIIKDIKVQRSPQWMRDRLRKVGVRPINNVVDITNYVLFEVGQPLHAFDTEFVTDCGIIVRKAKAKESITALNSETYELTENMLVIADCKKPLAIAGVMGGEYSGVSEKTSAVLLEAAGFAKGSVRATSRALGLRSDASARYEKGVDGMSVNVGRERALTLFHKLKAGKVTDSKASKELVSTSVKVIRTSADEISKLLGITVKSNAIEKILKSLQFDVRNEKDRLVITVPAFREDIDNYTDIAEEVIRFYGYDNIKSSFMPTAKSTAGGMDVRLSNLKLLKTLVSGLGAYEITTYSFIGKKSCDKLNLPQNSVLRRQIEILNPLGEEYSVMRTQLAHNMLTTVTYNLSKKNSDFRLFELGKTYIAKELPLSDLPAETDTLCMAFVGGKETFYTLKAAVCEILRKFALKPDKLEYCDKPYYHPGMSGEYFVNGKAFCSFGKVHPLVAKNYDIAENVYLCEMNLGGFICEEIPQAKFAPLSKFQAVRRDLAVVVKDEIPVGLILQTLEQADELCVDAELFDVYKGEQIEKGYKSIALSFGLSAKDRTLTDDDITSAVKKILAALEQNCGAKLR